MKAFGEAVGLLIALLVLVWAALIYFAWPDQKPVIACKPILVLTGGVETTASAAASAQKSSTSANTEHAPRVTDSATGRTLLLSDRIALGCLRFTDRLFNK